MPITLSCSCGRPLRAPDEFAGKRVRCPSCKRPVSIPRSSVGPGDPTPPPRTESREIVHFSCACGKGMRSLAEYAGRLARCPACGDNVIIPAPEPTTVQRFNADVRTPIPRRPPPPPADFEEIPELEEVRNDDSDATVVNADPTRRDRRPAANRMKLRSAMLLWFGLALFFLVSFGSCAWGVWWLVSHADTDPADPETPIVAPVEPAKMLPSAPKPPPMGSPRRR